MKRNGPTKPLVIIQCYEDRQPTLPLRRADNPPSQPQKRPDSEVNGNHNGHQNNVMKRPENPVQTLKRPSQTNGTTPNGATTNGIVKKDYAATNRMIKKDFSQINGVVKNYHPQTKKEATDIPPPPPPMPTTNGHINGNHKPTEHIKPMLAADLKAPNFRKNGTLTRTPTPDYNNKMDTLKAKDDKAELDSLESYKLKNPPNAPPKPPSNYFVKAPNGTTTMKKLTRPVSVTIGEYAYGGGRREPTKLEFLNGDKTDGPNTKLNGDDDISNRLQSELVMTLSRSNLRKKTEAMADVTR